ncbi:hypothetical protein SPB21_10610 [Leptothoe sp. ISB3NOV94-8A]
MKDNFLKRIISKCVFDKRISVPVDNVTHYSNFSSKFDEYHNDGISTENYSNGTDSWYRKKDKGNTEEEFSSRVGTFKQQRSNPEDTMPSDKKPGHFKKDVKDTSIYKVSLPVPSNEKERHDLHAYKEKVKKSGWILTPIRSASSDDLEYILSPEGSELDAAAYIAASVLDEALGRAS